MQEDSAGQETRNRSNNGAFSLFGTEKDVPNGNTSSKMYNGESSRPFREAIEVARLLMIIVMVGARKK